jgi:altronate dehydratase small subunit
MVNAMMIHRKDDVAVVIEDIKKGEIIRIATPDDEIHEIKAMSDIPVYHKVAVRDIAKGSPVIKYGERIGVACEEIKQGMHVHVHNLKSAEEN